MEAVDTVEELDDSENEKELRLFAESRDELLSM